MRRVWQQFSRLNPSVYSAALRGGCCVPLCVADLVLLIVRYVSNLINGHYYYYYYYYYCLVEFALGATSALSNCILLFITGLPNGPVLFCWLSSVVVCNAAGRRAGRPPGAWTVGASGAWAVRRPTLHGWPVLLRPVRATPCFILYESKSFYVSCCTAN